MTLSCKNYKEGPIEVGDRVARHGSHVCGTVEEAWPDGLYGGGYVVRWDGIEKTEFVRGKRIDFTSDYQEHWNRYRLRKIGLLPWEPQKESDND